MSAFKSTTKVDGMLRARFISRLAKGENVGRGGKIRVIPPGEKAPGSLEKEAPLANGDNGGKRAAPLANGDNGGKRAAPLANGDNGGKGGHLDLVLLF